MIKGLIFDLDGVIVFTDKYHFQAWKEMADKENIYFDEEINNREAEDESDDEGFV